VTMVDGKPFANAEDVMDLQRDTRAMRSLKELPKDLQEAFNNTLHQKIYAPVNEAVQKESLEWVRNHVPGMKGIRERSETLSSLSVWEPALWGSELSFVAGRRILLQSSPGHLDNNSPTRHHGLRSLRFSFRNASLNRPFALIAIHMISKRIDFWR